MNNLENKLCVIIFRMHFVLNIMQGKYLIKNGAIFVNKQKIFYPHFKLNKDDIVSMSTEYFGKYIVNRNNLIDVSTAFIKTDDNPYLYVKFRALTGIFLYNPIKPELLLTIKKPDIFFPQEVSHEKDQIVDNKIFNYKNKTTFGGFKRTNLLKKYLKESNSMESKNKFMEHFASLRMLNYKRIPVENARVLFSYFLKY